VGLDHADEAVFEAPQLLSGIRWFYNSASIWQGTDYESSQKLHRPVFLTFVEN
jgi:hypothetical protein